MPGKAKVMYQVRDKNEKNIGRPFAGRWAAERFIADQESRFPDGGFHIVEITMTGRTVLL